MYIKRVPNHKTKKEKEKTTANLKFWNPNKLTPNPLYSLFYNKKLSSDWNNAVLDHHKMTGYGLQ